MIYKFFRSLLFKLEPETSHRLTLQLMRLGGLQPMNAILRAVFAAPHKPVEAFGLKFKNPVGLAAGYDKDGVALRGLAALGFGHIEIGTVTPRPQSGNPRPRLFRLTEDEAVINRLGFPGKGAEFLARQLSYTVDGPRRSPRRGSTVIGINLGKNKDTPLEDAAQDYLMLMRRFMTLADYLTINISSPNTVGLRRLQGREMLESLLGAIAAERRNIAAGQAGNAPILVKLAPDLSDEELDDAVGAILAAGMDGIIATNTTLSREGLRSRYRAESGGLSGKPLREKSDAVLSKVVKRVAGKVPVVGVGGIMNADDAKRKLDLGATLVQVYSGMVYAGPGLVKDILAKI
jgi:dihydroorotate dehydrogenase